MNIKFKFSLLGGRRLLEVPEFDGVILRGRDEDGLHRVEGQTPDWVEVAPQGELWVPGLPESVFVIGDLREGVVLFTNYVMMVETDLSQKQWEEIWDVVNVNEQCGSSLACVVCFTRWFSSFGVKTLQNIQVCTLTLTPVSVSWQPQEIIGAF